MLADFLADAAPFLTQASDAVKAGAPAEAAGPLQAIALDAGALDMKDLATLVTALAVAAESPTRDDAAFAAGLQALTQALTDLENADESGARYDAGAIRAATDALRTLAPPPPSILPPAPVADDSTWEPTVDEDMIDPFLEECHDRLESLSDRLIELEGRPDDPELLRAVFRDLHTLKGSSGFVGLSKMARLAHAAEDLVGQLRDAKRSVDRPVIDALLATLDVLVAIVQRAADRAPIDVDVQGAIGRLRAPGPRTSPAPTTAPAATSQEPASARVQQTLRIDFAKLDELMNLVGELVLSKGQVQTGIEDLDGLAREIETQRRGARRGTRSSARSGPVRLQDFATELGRVQRAFDSLRQELQHAHQQLDFVSGQLRDQVMKLRMVPVGRSWSKYHRTVRQIAGPLGKDVRLELTGEDTELDKVLVEQLDEPLMHLVRNAIDHGMEPESERVAAGKEPQGTLRLSAFHRGNQIVVQIGDDGRGIDPAKVRGKAVERGLVSKEAAEELEVQQVYDLIFHAGFSTAERVSDLSGRGVGMDVVRETISRLKGTVHVDSELGRGTTFELRLPLTLAIVQVLLLRVAGQTFAVPLDLVRRTLAVSPETIRLTGHQETLLLRGAEVPLLRIDRLLRLQGATGLRGDLAVVLVEIGNQRVGLACDEFLGRREVVLKTLGTLIRRLPGAAGATLLGDRPAIILDVPALVAMAVTDPDAAKELVEAPTSEVSADAKRILVVEDSDVIRESIRRTLEREGFDVVTARDGADGLARAREGSFDLVSTDVVMPRMDGYELTRRLRGLDAYRDIPILMVTSKEERIDRIRGFDAGVDAYLTKPTDAEELLRIIRRHLAKS
ncbi:MAG: response regulator [Myxococcota bacterium]